MDLFFIPANLKKQVVLPEKVVSALPKHLCLAVTAQLLSQLKDIKEQLEQAGKSVSYVSGKHTRFPGQILGCSWAKLLFPKETEAFLYVGEGVFHPEAIMLASDKPVYRYDPSRDSFELLSSALVRKLQQKAKAGLTSFLRSENIGVLLSTKPGQQQLHRAMMLKEQFPDKNFYYLTSNNVDFSQLENFSFIECFVNTSCNRLLDDYNKFPRPFTNIEDVDSLKKA